MNDTPVLAELRYLLRKHGAPFGLDSRQAELVLANRTVDVPRLVLDLLELEKRRLDQEIASEMLTAGKAAPRIGIFSPTAAYSRPLIEFYRALRDAGYVCRLLTADPENAVILDEPGGAYFGRGFIRNVDCFDVFIVAVLMDCLPPQAICVYMVHDILDSPLGEEDEFVYFAGYWDYLLVPSRPSMSMLQDLFQRRPPARPLSLVPSGYLRLDLNIADEEQFAGERDAIVYAPTVMATSTWRDFVTVYQHARNIIDQLLNAFPSYQIIFRPHPHSVHEGEVQLALEHFRSNARVEIDLDAGKHMHSYSRAKLLVTDFSGTAYTFAFSTLRPVLFVSLNEDAAVTHLVAPFYFAHRHTIGDVATTIPEIREKALSLADRAMEFRESIMKLRGETVFNLSSSLSAIMASIPDIVTRSSRPGWLSVPASPPPTASSSAVRPGGAPDSWNGFNLFKTSSGGAVGLKEQVAASVRDDPLMLEIAKNLGLAFVATTNQKLKEVLDTQASSGSVNCPPVLLEQNYCGFNLVEVDETVVAVDMAVGPVDLSNGFVRELLARDGYLIVAGTLSEVRQLVDEYVSA